jgi:hypothetical protein
MYVVMNHDIFKSQIGIKKKKKQVKNKKIKVLIKPNTSIDVTRVEFDRFRFRRKLGGHHSSFLGVPFDVTEDIFNASDCVMTVSVVWLAKADNLFQFV